MSRLVLRLRGIVENIGKISASPYATFTQKDFLYEDHSHSGTLINRFAKLIAYDNSCEAKIVRNSIKYSNFYPVHDQQKFSQELQKVESDQLARLLMFTANYRGNADIAKIFKVINQLDNEVDQRIEEMEYREVQEIMFMFLYLLPNKVTQLDAIRNGVQKLIDGFPQNNTKENFLQICFYLGLFKKSRKESEQLKAFLGIHLSKYIHALDSLQFALVANSAFKAAVMIPDQEFHQRLTTEILQMDQYVDMQLLVTFVKSLRHNRVDCGDVLDKVQQMLENRSIPNADLRGFTHLLALFVENRHLPTDLGSYVVKECMVIIQEEQERSMILSRDDRYMNPNFRPKDLATFLWCCTSLPDGIFTRDDMKNLTNAIIWKLRNYEYKYSYDEFVDTLLSLFMLGGKSEALFKAFFTEKNFLIPPKSLNRAKLDSRQQLLITCLEIECPEVVPKDVVSKTSKGPSNVPDYLLEKRPQFVCIGQILKDLTEELKITKIQSKIPVRNINIPSYWIEIEMTDGKKVTFWLELLDKQATMADSKTPTAILRLKMRLLRNMEQDFVAVSKNF